MSEAKLGVVDIEITHRDGVELFNPHTLIMAIHDASDHTLDFAPTDQISAISKKPALIYRTDEVTIPLTSEEISRLTLRNLTSEEYFSLKEAYGKFFEIHDDFYEDTTGEAMQPAM